MTRQNVQVFAGKIESSDMSLSGWSFVSPACPVLLPTVISPNHHCQPGGTVLGQLVSGRLLFESVFLSQPAQKIFFRQMGVMSVVCRLFQCFFWFHLLFLSLLLAGDRQLVDYDSG